MQHTGHQPRPGAPYTNPPAPVLVGRQSRPASSYPGRPQCWPTSPILGAMIQTHQPCPGGSLTTLTSSAVSEPDTWSETNTGCAGRGQSAQHRPVPGLPQQAGFGQANVGISNQHTKYKTTINQSIVMSNRLNALTHHRTDHDLLP